MVSKGVFIIGTDTNIGKTVVSAGLMHVLRSNKYNVCYFKPVLSGAIYKNDLLYSSDTHFVKKVSELDEEFDNITPYAFKTPVSPHLAARIENKSIDISVIKSKFQFLKEKYEYIIAEGMGGIIVPVTNERYMLFDLIKELKMDCLLVARAGVGTINHTALTVNFAKSIGLKIKGIIINQYTNEFYENDNIKIIEELTKIPVIAVIPRFKDVDTERFEISNIRQVFDEKIKCEAILNMMGEI